MPRPPSASVRKPARLRKERTPAGAADGVSSSLARDLDMDILGALPLELSIRVLKYLTPAESILLRLVSKSYHDLLTSEEVCSSLSHHFIKREYNAAKKLDSWRLHYENHISRRLSYGFGKPWLTEVLPSMSSSFCAETGYLASVPETKCDSVQVLDLNTHPAEYVFPPTRAPDSSDIKDVVLLPSFVVVLTWMDRGYSWNLKTHRLYRFEVPGPVFFTPIDGNGSLIVITLQDLVIVHDLQAEKASSFKGIGDNMRIWEGEEVETVCHGMTFAIANAEKRTVWLFRELRAQSILGEKRVFAIDSLRLETGEPVVPGEVRSFALQSYCGNGRWQFWGDESSARRATNSQAKRVVLDTGTGAWTEEPYTIMFPAGLPEFDSRTRYSCPITCSDGLGCFVGGFRYSEVWMLDQEPGDRVTRARPLALNALTNLRAIGGGSIYCLGICDNFVLLGDGVITAVVIRFKGIHDSDRQPPGSHPP